MALSKDEILKRMLARVPNKFDKREGSVIYDALAPVAYELEQVLLDYEEKYNAFKSCIYSFGFNKNASSFSFDGRVAEVRNLYYTGQWLSNPGGYLNAIINAYYLSDRIKNDN